MIDHDATDMHIQVHGNTIEVTIEDHLIGGEPVVHTSLSVEGVLTIIREHLTYDPKTKYE